MTAVGGRICMRDKGSCCCWVLRVVQPGGGREGRAAGSAAASAGASGRNVSGTKRLRSRSRCVCAPVSGMHRGHAGNTSPLTYRAASGVERGGCPKIKGEGESDRPVSWRRLLLTWKMCLVCHCCHLERGK